MAVVMVEIGVGGAGTVAEGLCVVALVLELEEAALAESDCRCSSSFSFPLLTSCWEGWMHTAPSAS